MATRIAVLGFAAALAVAQIACGDGDPPATPSAPPPADAAAPPPAPADAGPIAAEPAPADDEPFVTGEEFHLDEPSLRRPAPTAAPPPTAPIELTLRSTPPRARVLVDGEPVGETPAYWKGASDGSPREFTFVLPGHEMARYRFVPTRSGIVHATLERLPGPLPADAGPGAP